MIDIKTIKTWWVTDEKLRLDLIASRAICSYATKHMVMMVIQLIHLFTVNSSSVADFPVAALSKLIQSGASLARDVLLIQPGFKTIDHRNYYSYSF